MATHSSLSFSFAGFSGLLLAGFLSLVSSAQAGEVLKIYSTMPEKNGSTVFEAFTRKTGIETQVIRLSAGEALARLEAEKNNRQADVLFGGPGEVFEVAAEQKMLEILPPSGDGIPEQFRSKDGSWNAWGIMPLVFMTNANFLKTHGLKAPESWVDLLDPAYRNSLQMADARTSGTATERIYALVKLYGEDGAFDYQKKLHQNVQLYTKSGQGGAIPIATGQAASGVFYLPDALDIQQQGYPVVVTYPKDGTTYGVTGVAIIKGAGKLDAARQFIDWVGSVELANLLMEKKINYVPVHRDAKITDPVLDVSQVKFFEADAEWKGEKRKGYIARWINEVVQ